MVDTPSVFVQDIVVDEKIGTADFIVRLGNDSLGQSSNSTITVDYTTSNGSATAGSDFVGKSGTLTFAPGETVKTVAIDIIDDALVEGQEFFGLNLSNAVNVSIVHGNALARIGANDSSPVSQPILSVAKDLVVNESAGYIDVVVSLSAPSASVVRVSYATANGTADGNGYDFETASGTLNFAAGETTKTVRIQLSSYSGVENLEFFTFNLSGAANASIPAGLGTTTIWIVDNDTVIDTPSVFVQDIVVDEKSGIASFFVTLGTPGNINGASSNSTVKVDYTTSNGSATAGSDFVGRSGTLIFAPGESAKTVVVEILADNQAESAESFTFNLSNAINAAIEDGTATATINANSADPVPTLSSISPTNNAANVAISSDLVFNFSEAVQAGVGSLLIYNSTGVVVRSIDVTDISQVTFGGSTMTVNPSTDLDAGTAYYVNFTSGVVKDLSNNAFSGISGASAFGFTTGGSNYILSASANSFNEGGIANFILTTSGLANGTVLGYTLSGIQSADVTDGQLSGTLTINNNSATLGVALAADVTTEGTETLTVSITGTSVSGSTVINDTSKGTPTATPSKDAQFVVLQYASAGIVGADVGNDTYLISGSMVSAGQNITISDANGSNSVQLASGLSIASSQVASNALKLTLSNGGTVTVLGADRFTYDVGGNNSAGIDNTDVGYTSFVQSTLGVALPIIGIVSGGAKLIGTGPAKTAIPVASKLDDFLVLQNASAAIVGADVGNDTYLISSSMVAAGQNITISDANGNNSLQLASGLSIASSQVANNALKLTLSNGGTVTVLGADRFTYDVGGNNSAGIDNTDVGYTSFVQNTLGAALPISGIVNGGAKVIGSGSETPLAAGSSISVTATSQTDTFSFFPAAARALTANTQITINQFNTTQDKFQLDLATALGNTTLAALSGVEGINVQTDPFAGSTLVNFGLDANGDLVTLTLLGVTAPSLIVVNVI